MIPWSLVVDRGGWGLAAVAFTLVFFGQLVPRRLVRDRDDALAKERARNDNLVETLKKLVAYAETADRILQALHREGDKRDNAGDDARRG